MRPEEEREQSLIRDWVEELGFHSRLNRERTLRLWKMHTGGGSLLGATGDDVRKFVDFLRAKEYAPGTVNLHLSGLRTFFGLVVRKGVLAEDPTHGVTFVPNPERARTRGFQGEPLSKADIARIIDHASNDRDRTLFLAYYHTGANLAEMLATTWADVGEDPPSLRLQGGGKIKARTVRLSRRLHRALEDLRPDPCEPEDFLFRTSTGRALTRNQVRQALQNAARKAGVDAKVGVSRLREAHAVHSLEAGAPPDAVQEMLGLAQLSAVVRYMKKRTSPPPASWLD